MAAIEGPGEGSLEITGTQSNYRTKYASGGPLRVIPYTCTQDLPRLSGPYAFIMNKPTKNYMYTTLLQMYSVH